MRCEKKQEVKGTGFWRDSLYRKPVSGPAMQESQNKPDQPIRPSSSFADSLFRVRGDQPSPYPRHLESVEVTRSGAPILIRPAWAGDVPLLIQLFNCLSWRSIEFRFLCNIKSLPRQWLEAFCSIDYDRDVAMVAARATRYGERIVAACHIFRDHESNSGEVALVVADPWQRKGIGTLLLARSMVIARRLGMRSIWGLVPMENKPGLALAEKFRFRRNPEREEGLYRFERTLLAPDPGAHGDTCPGSQEHAPSP